MFSISYSRFGCRVVDSFRDKRVACAVASHLARFTGAPVNVWENLKTPVRSCYLLLVTTIRPR
jgi:hypothetical protein